MKICSTLLITREKQLKPQWDTTNDKSTRMAKIESTELTVEGRLMASKDVHALIPRTCDYVTVHGKWVFAGAIKGADVKMGKLWWLSG